MTRRLGSLVLPAVLLTLALTACSSSSSSTTPSSSTAASSASSSASSASSSAAPASTEVAEGTLDQNRLADAIKANLSTSLGAAVTVTVQCTPGVAIKQAASSACEAKVDDQPLPFTVTQTDDAGNVDFKAAAALLDMAALQSQTAQQYATQKGGTWVTNCFGADKPLAYVVHDVGDSFPCTFEGKPKADASAETRAFTVTVKDLDGNISWGED